MRPWRFRGKGNAEPAPVSFHAVKALSPAQWEEVLSGAPDLAARLVGAAARYGLVEAQVILGQMLLDGRGIARDPVGAAGWFSAAAGAGYPPAINMLGRCHECGWGMPANFEAAALLYHKAARLGLDWAQFNFANLLLRGLGVARDRGAALVWLHRAARQGHAKAMNLIGRAMEEGWDQPSNPTAALPWYRAAAEGGDFRGQFNLATILMHAGDLPQATRWFTEALRSRNPDILAATKALASHPEPALQALAAQARTLQGHHAAGLSAAV